MCYLWLSNVNNSMEKNNKYFALYSRLSNQSNSSLYQESRGVREPSNECKKLREDTLKKLSRCFKEVLSKEDMMDHPPVKIWLKENNDIAPSYSLHPYDTPFHLRRMYEIELKIVLMREFWKNAEQNHHNGLRRLFLCSN